MGELGISIYPSKSNLTEMKDYIAQAAEIGYQRIFTSMLEVADNPSEKSTSPICLFKLILKSKPIRLLLLKFTYGKNEAEG